MHFEQFIHQSIDDPQELEFSMLQSELADAQKTIRTLQRQTRKAQAQYAEILRAYDLTVKNLVKTTSRCMQLEQEYDSLRRRAGERVATTVFSTGPLMLTTPEVAAIRKAIARLHHPDVGGDAERMKAWNTLLDRFEDEQ